MLTYLLVAGIAYGIAYGISATGAAYWRAFVGFILAFIVAWLGGGYMTSVLLFPSGGDGHAMSQLIAKSMGWAILWSGWGVYRGRKKLRERSPTVPNDVPDLTRNQDASNDAFANAMAEIEEGRLDKGVWARCFAQAEGDDAKAKAGYIKARAESMKDAAVWVDTRPPSAQGAGVKVAEAGQAPSPVTKSFATSPIEIVVWVIFVLAIFGWWQSQEYAKRQELAARPVQTGPGWDKDAIAPPESVSAQDLYVQKVRAIQEKAKRGELSSVDGETSLEPPKNLAQWPGAESLKLENSQTWWRNGTKQFNVHVQNTTPYELTTLALDFGQQGCESAIAQRRFYVSLRQIVTPGSQALLRFTPPFAVSDTPNNCLVVSSAWQPVKAIPAKAQAARLATTTNEESGKERAQNKQVQADLDAIAQRAVRDYPYLDTPAGQEVLDKIVKKRDEFIQQGQYPSVALTNAVNAFAPANAPRPNQEKKPLPVLESGDKGNHAGFDPKCRWVTPQEWSCK